MRDGLALKEAPLMESIKIPTSSEIARMSLVVCERERTRLRNEVSFARGNALGGGPSADTIIDSCNEAITAINARLAEAMAYMRSYMETPTQEANWSWKNVILG